MCQAVGRPSLQQTELNCCFSDAGECILSILCALQSSSDLSKNKLCFLSLEALTEYSDIIAFAM